MTQRRVVLHLDMDAFYASIEQRDDPSLRGKPVIIGADPQGGTGRGVVAAASYEARAYGVHSAMPISRAWRACPTGVYLRPRFRVYRRVSDEVFELLEASVDVLEPASIDEAYAEVTQRCRGSFARAQRLAEALKKRIQAEQDLTCSIGVAPNKLVAKIASDLDKPDGLTVVQPDRVASVLGPLSAKVIPGVGPKTYEALREIGVETVAQLAEQDPDAMAERFGTWGPGMVASARGQDERPVDPHWERKSAGAETTFHQDLPPEQARGHIPEVAEEALSRLGGDGIQGRTITLKVRLTGFETFTRSRTLPAPTDDPAIVTEVACALFDEAPVDGHVRLLGVRISGLDRSGPRQATLQAWPADVLGEAELKDPRDRPVWRF